MKALSFSIAFLVAATVATAQKVYFTYLQTDGSLPFYVKMGGKTYSSTAGYLILPNLRDSNYSLALGYPDRGVETKFNVAINGKDRGFLIKNFDNDLGLFDMQSLAVTKPAVDVAANVAYQTKTDSFSQMLSKAANDTSLLKVPVKQETVVEPKKETVEEKPNPVVQEAAKQDVTVNNQKEIAVEKTKAGEHSAGANDLAVETPVIIAAESKEKPVVKAGEGLKATAVAGVVRYSESATTDGFNVVYFDHSNGLADTIRLIIPNPKSLAVITEQPPKKEEPVAKQDMIAVADLPQKEELKKPDMAAPVKEAPVAMGEKKANNCPAIANDDDFFKIRKNMVSKNNEEGMIGEAKKYFKNKCFTTEQVKYLSALFMTAEGKYGFFDAAYSHVTDKEKFASLGAELKDEYYVNRFKAMLQ